MSNGTILGRPANLFTTALGAIYNLFVVFTVFGFTPTAEQNAAVNVAILAIVLLIANQQGSNPDATP